MGNFCNQHSQNDCHSDKILRKRTVSQSSTRSNEPDFNNTSPIKSEQLNLRRILSSGVRISMRQNCPHINNLEVLSELGRGGQAEIYQIRVHTLKQIPQSQYENGNQTFLALKRIHLKTQQKNKHSIQLASNLLIQNDCPFLMKGYFYCENGEYIYQGMRLAEGGDLNSFLEKTIGKGDAFRRLGENGIKMVVAGIVLGLEYLHQHNLIYCDLKTDNVLICSDGYPMLADFQLTRQGKEIPVIQYQGTITSVGPEIFLCETFDRGVDLWALGILIYNLAYNQCPYSKQEIVEEEFVKQCEMKENKYRLKRKKISNQLTDLINKLLKVKSRERLGYNSMEEIKKHEFFKDFEWDLYAAKQLYNPLEQIVKKYPLKRNRMSCPLQI